MREASPRDALGEEEEEEEALGTEGGEKERERGKGAETRDFGKWRRRSRVEEMEKVVQKILPPFSSFSLVSLSHTLTFL